MHILALSGESRDQFGKTRVKKYRAQELVPCSLYNEGTATHFSLPYKEAIKAIYTPHTYLIQLNVGSVDYRAVITSKHFHPVHEQLLHIEMLQVHEDKPIRVEIPLELTGTAEGALAGGKLVQKVRKLRVMGLASKLPKVIEVDISFLRLGKSMKVRELEFQDFTIMMAGDVPIATVEITRQLRQEAAKLGR